MGSGLISLPFYRMKKGVKNIWYSTVLAILLLLQTGTHAIHIFTSHHLSHDETHADTTDAPIEESLQDCELCAKLAGQPLYLGRTFEILPQLIVPFQNFLSRDTLLHSFPFAIHTQRGPPTLAY